eukprot:CAMPEP_0119125628 /NCGR_PEP_ID=MMETSP1310-20130426/4839_1 /TAXON_ID=464262 /ORGANISM="Genus nov. species nov., Strain RCC2339" /LENGTH=77 /DNA_ID=CAMNT_0007115713 /DNA_START=190 /DNA_END=420 /DNA_ORIENTATION=-
MEEFRKWLREELEKLELDDNIQGKYIVAMLEEDLTTEMEKRADMKEFFTCSLPDHDGVLTFADQIVDRWLEVGTKGK